MSAIASLKTASAGVKAQTLALNNQHAADLSWLEPSAFDHLVDQAFCAWVIGSVDGFMIGLDQDADYSSPNFLWFKGRYPRFAYVDRIAIDEAARGRGLARTLYTTMFKAAYRAGHAMVVCEVNADPPNLASDALHRSLGFEIVGQDRIYGGQRLVSYYRRALKGADAEI